MARLFHIESNNDNYEVTPNKSDDTEKSLYRFGRIN